MRRFFSISLVAMLLLGLVSAVPAGAKSNRVEVCHVNGVSDVIPTFHPASDLRTFYPGKMISVAEAAVDGLVAHGDSAMPGNGDGGYRTDAAGLANIRQSADNNGLTVWKHADCFITRYP